jgi:hypothetical protein
MTYTYLIPQIPSDKDHIQIGATNLAIRLQVREGNNALDISSASNTIMIIERPDSTLISASASFVTDGTDGLIVYYTSGSSDLNQEGDYNVQAYIQIPGFTGYTTPVTFTVYQNLPLDDVVTSLP